jgi:hypothetical protein
MEEKGIGGTKMMSWEGELDKLCLQEQSSFKSHEEFIWSNSTSLIQA